MKSRLPNFLGFLALLFLSAGSISMAATPKPASPDERRELIEKVTKGLSGGSPIELKTLEIRARIFEPQVIYILDRTKLDVDLKEEDVKFTPRIFEPIEEDRLP